MKTRPHVINIENGVYRLDLRSKRFDAVRQMVSAGKRPTTLKPQTLEVLMLEWLKEKERKKHVLKTNPPNISKQMYDTLFCKAHGENGYIAQFADRPIATITTEEIREWIEPAQHSRRP